MNHNVAKFIGHEQAKGDNEVDQCAQCGLKFLYLSGQKYCPTCDFDDAFPESEEPII